MAERPIVVEVWRGEMVESRHRGQAIVIDRHGQTVLEIGGADEMVFPRSSMKPFQTLALVESGAADARKLSLSDVALACASHSAQPFHTERVQSWLGELGLGEEALGCGPQAPMHRDTKLDLIRSGQAPTRLHNNCSGKHVGMLTTARHCLEPVEGYLDVDHPIQRRIKANLEKLGGETLVHAPGIDGCGAPNWPMSLAALATAAMRLATGKGVDLSQSKALVRIAQAMAAEPQMVAGTGRCCTDIMQICPGILAKTGAEGVYMLSHIPSGMGIALKIEDGATRAAETFAIGILRRLSLIDDAQIARLSQHFEPVLKNFGGQCVGRIALVQDGI